jgi:hypothetical protein
MLILSGSGRDSTNRYRIQTGPGTHLNSCPIITEGFYRETKAAGPWS